MVMGDKMDINTNILQSQSAVIAPLKITNIGQPVDSVVKSKADATQKAEAQPVSNGVSVVDEEKVTQAVSKLNDFVQNTQRNLQFSVDQKSGAMVVKVIDAATEKVIRQMPTEETLRLARSLAEQSDEAGFNIFSSKA
jgi:flagellar protein FlaG